MSKPWLRLYTEIIDDEKLLMLAFQDRWHYVALLCLKGKGVLDSEPDPERLDRKVAIKLGLTQAEADEVRRRLMTEGLIDNRWQPAGWDERQYETDSSRERTRKWRERKRKSAGDASVTESDVTVTSPGVTRDGVTVTAQEADTESDSEYPSPSGEGARRPAASAPPPCPHDEIIELYHEVLPELPRMETWRPQHQQHLRARWRESPKHQNLRFWKRFFEFIRSSDFLMGRKKEWRADLRWLVQATHFDKVKNGEYHDAPRAAAGGAR